MALWWFVQCCHCECMSVSHLLLLSTWCLPFSFCCPIFRIISKFVFHNLQQQCKSLSRLSTETCMLKGSLWVWHLLCWSNEKDSLCIGWKILKSNTSDVKKELNPATIKHHPRQKLEAVTTTPPALIYSQRKGCTHMSLEGLRWVKPHKMPPHPVTAPFLFHKKHQKWTFQPETWDVYN